MSSFNRDTLLAQVVASLRAMSDFEKQQALLVTMGRLIAHSNGEFTGEISIHMNRGRCGSQIHKHEIEVISPVKH